MKIAIVGGAGKMGLWLARFLLQDKHEVILIDSDAARLVSARTQLGVEASPDKNAVQEAEAIVISVPIDRFEEAAKELSQHVREGQIAVDITSVKAMPVDVMHRYLGRCRVLGAHPVFGPGASGLAGHNVVLTPTCDAESELALKTKPYLEARGAHVQLMTPEEHDRLMAVVLGLAHFIAIVSGDTLLALDNLRNMEHASGVTFRLLMTLVGSVLGEDPSLYASIQNNLPGLPAIEKDFIKKASQWAELVKHKDSAEFVRCMNELRVKLEQSTSGSSAAYADMYRITSR